MLNLTFGEQVKIILNRNGMTIKELAEKIERETGKKMSRQNLTQRLGRDNFQEQDMRMIAGILGRTLQLSILDGDEEKEPKKKSKTVFLKPNENLRKEFELPSDSERDMTIGELVEIHEELDALEQPPGTVIKEYIKEQKENRPEPEKIKPIQQEGMSTMNETEVMKQDVIPEVKPEITPEAKPETKKQGEINPYTGREYETNSVRIHPNRIGYVQVYDRADGKWADMTEWAFLGFQERKKALLGNAYEPPVYLD